MISRNSSAIPLLFSGLKTFVRAAFAALLLVASGTPGTFGAQGVTVELGIPGDTIREHVETNDASGTLSPGPEHSSSMAASPAKPAAPKSADLLEAVKKRFPHLFEPVSKILDRRRERPSPLSEVLSETVVTTAPGGGGIRVSGAGSAKIIARDDGEVVISSLLKTYDEAFQEIRLFDPDGVEVTFDGRPLFSWQRPDDKAFAPVEFKGQRDKGSMERVKGGDYSPREGLKYRFFLKRGQRLELRTGGKALSDSVLEVRGDNL